MAAPPIATLALATALAAPTVTAAHADEPAPPPSYPALHAARPLLLPSGLRELTLALPITSHDVSPAADDGTDTESDLLFEPRLRLGLCAIELEGAVRTLVAGQADGAAERLRVVSLTTRYRLSPDAGVGLELATTMPLADLPTVRAMARYQHRLHLARRGALTATVGTGLQRQALPDALADAPLIPLLLEARLRALVQVSSFFAVEFEGGLVHHRPLAGTGVAPHTVYDLGFTTTFPVSASVDFVIGFPAFTRDSAEIVLGLALRRPRAPAPAPSPSR